jgi:hypothetical protein
MADTKTIKTRIKNRFDTLTNWQGTGVELLPGEIALVSVSEAKTDDNGNIIQVPAVLMKVGENDAEGNPKAFSALPWLSAKAADVYNWAKIADPSNIEVKYNNGTTSSPSWQKSTLANILQDLDVAKSNISSLTSNTLGSISVTPTPATTNGVVQGVTYDSDTGTFTVAYDTVATNDISDNAVTTEKIKDSNVTDAKIVSVSASKVEVTPKSGDTGAVMLPERLDSIAGEIAGIKESIAGGVHFRGTVTDKPTSANVTVNGSTSATTVIAGDVVIWADKGIEYIYTGSNWEELGDVTRVGAIETTIADMGYDGGDAGDNKFATKVTQDNGKISVTYARPDASNISYGTDSDVKTALDAHAGKISVVESKLDGVTKVTTSITDAIGALDFSDPTASTETSTTFIETVSQTDGKISATKKTLPTASTTEAGIVQLDNTISSSSTTTAATANAVKTAYDTGLDAQSRVAAVEDDYMRIGSDSKMYQGKSGENMIIFDCGGASI